jgi:hypothetical protein
MKIVFDISDEDARRAREFYHSLRSNPFVRTRQSRNVDGSRAPANSDEFWEALVSALLTTQQRSGPTSAVNRFIRAAPFPLGLSDCRANSPCAAFIEHRIMAFGGIRRGRTIAGELQANLTWLDRDGWDYLLPRLSSLGASTSPTLERETARYLSDNLKGLGPKQARNVLQMLGLTRYETPLDSRIAKWLNGFGFPVHLTAGGLSDHSYYELVSDGFQALCERAGVLPCLMDAAIFASYDGAAWDEEEVVKW